MKSAFWQFWFWITALVPGPVWSGDSLRLVLQLPQAALCAETDPLGNLYVADASRAVIKYDKAGKPLAKYSNIRLGALDALDAANPQKLLLWYRDFQTAVYLDRNLAELTAVDFRQGQFSSVECVAAASDGNLWLYDGIALKLFKITPFGEILSESAPMPYLGQGSGYYIRDAGDQVYLGIKNRILVRFNRFGRQEDILLRDSEAPALFDAQDDIFYMIKEGENRLFKAFHGQTVEYPLPPDTEAEEIAGLSGNYVIFANAAKGTKVYALTP